jgi:type IV pilus assembly protein PilM
VFFGRGKRVVGLDIGSFAVRAVEASRSGSSLTLTGFAKARIEPPEAIEETVIRVLEDAGTRTKRTATAVSGRSVIVRSVPMMPLPEAEFEQQVRLEVAKYIPWEFDEVVHDAQRVEDPMATPGQQTPVVMVAVKRTMIEEHLAMLDRLGLQPAVIDVDVFALGNAFEARNRRLGLVDDEIRGLVDIGASKTCINIMRGSTSVFTREIYTAGNDLTEAVVKRFGVEPDEVEHMKQDPGAALATMQDAFVSVLEDIRTEIKMSFDFIETQYDREVKEVFISGGSVLFPGMDRMLSNVSGLETRLWDPMEALEIGSQRFNAGQYEGMNSDMAVAVGLATRVAGS